MNRLACIVLGCSFTITSLVTAPLHAQQAALDARAPLKAQLVSRNQTRDLTVTGKDIGGNVETITIAKQAINGMPEFVSLLGLLNSIEHKDTVIGWFKNPETGCIDMIVDFGSGTTIVIIKDNQARFACKSAVGMPIN